MSNDVHLANGAMVAWLHSTAKLDSLAQSNLRRLMLAGL